MISTTIGTLQKKYKLICPIGEGSYGSVYLFQVKGHHKNTVFQKIFQNHREVEGDYVAVKIYKKPRSKSEGIDFSCLREISCLQQFQHHNILNCIQVVYSYRKDTPNPFEIAAVMNFHIQLKPLLDQCDHNQKKRVAKQIVTGLNHLHSNYYFHRDLKTDNIFVSRAGYVKLADFGFTKEFGTPYKKYTYNACTLQYRAPQLFLNTHYYTQKSDIWSLGCVILYLFLGKNLFELDGTAFDIDMLSQIFYYFGSPKQVWPGFSKCPVKYNFKDQKPKNLATELGIPDDVSNFISKVMILDPAKRPSAAEILKFDFFEGVSSDPFDVKDIFQKKLLSFIK